MQQHLQQGTENISCNTNAVFQWMLLIQIKSISNNEVQLTEEHHIFSTNSETEAWLQKVSSVIKTLMNLKWSLIDSPGNVDANTIYQELLKDVRLGSQVPMPNVVIFEAGKEPNADKNIYEACQAYYKDLGLMDEYNLDIWADYDQAIHSHLVHIKNNEEYSCKLWLGLGQ